MNSLTFPSTGVPYLGAVTINAAPPAGQPFAGDSYITGPDWGAYGYEPGDEITISGATNVNPRHRLHRRGHRRGQPLSHSGSTIQCAHHQGNDADVTVACTGFTPEIEAYTLSLNVTGTGELDLRCNSSDEPAGPPPKMAT